ncbi:hypothetical protein Ddc_16253 [Ditylenchus destructor]|nr:hypothetical protein Ddc_16253 [Ditylenchus destructor]
MSNSKPLPPFTFDVFCYLNRDQLERFSIVCRPLKNFIERYFHSKPYRVFDRLVIWGGSYVLVHNNVHWHPNRDDYSVQQFLAGEICRESRNWGGSFAEMRPYLGPTVRIKETAILATGRFTYNLEHITELESTAYLWREGKVRIWNAEGYTNRIVAKDFQPILNSPTILQCRELEMSNPFFPSKDYKVLYTVKVIENRYYCEKETALLLQNWQQFLEQPGVKPIVVFRYLCHDDSDYFLNRIFKAFTSATSPNAFKLVLFQSDKRRTEFREINKISGEILELKNGVPVEYKNECSTSETVSRRKFSTRQADFTADFRLESTLDLNLLDFQNKFGVASNEVHNKAGPNYLLRLTSNLRVD